MHDKISAVNVEKASDFLKDISHKIAEFEKIYGILTAQEKMLVGGIAFNVTSAWLDFSIIGIISPSSLQSYLVDQLITFVRFPPKDQRTITPDTKLRDS